MKDYTQNSYVGQRMSLVGVGELNIDQVHSSAYMYCAVNCQNLTNQ